MATRSTGSSPTLAASPNWFILLRLAEIERVLFVRMRASVSCSVGTVCPARGPTCRAQQAGRPRRSLRTHRRSPPLAADRLRQRARLVSRTERGRFSPPAQAESRESESDAMAAYQTLDANTDLVFFRPASMDDLDRIDELETAGYPADEAASREGITFRLEKASDLFMVAVRSSSNEVLGFINGTATAKEQLEEETMSLHDPEGETVCIHSVCVAEADQRKGIASRMLKAYVAWIQHSFPVASNVQLICKEDKMALYSKAGFQLVGPSKVVHGSDPWMDMKLQLPL